MALERLERLELAGFVLYLLLGLYLLLWHVPPLPLNHEAVGIGTNHVIHAVVGLTLLSAAGYVWSQNR